MSKRKSILIAAVAVVLIAALMLGAWLLLREKPTAGSKTFTVQVTHLDGSEKKFTLHTDEEYLGPALLNEGLISGTTESYGLFIDTVDGEKADSAQGQWWVFTVNGGYGDYGADSQPVQDGDSFEFSVYVG